MQRSLSKSTLRVSQEQDERIYGVNEEGSGGTRQDQRESGGESTQV